jgi:hypothetical protein
MEKDLFDDLIKSLKEVILRIQLERLFKNKCTKFHTKAVKDIDLDKVGDWYELWQKDEQFKKKYYVEECSFYQFCEWIKSQGYVIV